MELPQFRKRGCGCVKSVRLTGLQAEWSALGQQEPALHSREQAAHSHSLDTDLTQNVSIMGRRC